MKRSQLCLIVLLPMAIVGCSESDEEVANGDDPLRALTAAHPSDRYVSSYWTRKMGEDPELWSQAVAYCEQHNDAEHPNCAAVQYARALEVQSRPPEYDANTSLRPGAQTEPPNEQP